MLQLRERLVVRDDSQEHRLELGRKAALLLSRAALARPRNALQQAELEAWEKGLPTRI
jgi:hypothetical protein